MKRRHFIYTCGLVVLGISAVPATRAYRLTFHNGHPLLAARLRPLVTPEFAMAQVPVTPTNIARELKQKGVIGRFGKINAAKMELLAKSDPHIVFNGEYYTETEYKLYLLAYQLAYRLTLA